MHSQIDGRTGCRRYGSRHFRISSGNNADCRQIVRVFSRRTRRDRRCSDNTYMWHRHKQLWWRNFHDLKHWQTFTIRVSLCPLHFLCWVITNFQKAIRVLGQKMPVSNKVALGVDGHKIHQKDMCCNHHKLIHECIYDALCITWSIIWLNFLFSCNLVGTLDSYFSPGVI